MGCQEGRANSLRPLEKSRKAGRMADRAPKQVTTAPICAEIAGKRLELLETGAARLSALLGMIAGAQHSLKMLMYRFNPDHTGEAVRDALVGAALRGVDVKLL